VSTQDKLQWEARFRLPAALAAFLAALLLLVATVLFQSILEDRAGVRALPDFLLSVDKSPGTLVASAVMQALAGLSLILVFYYLFRAIVHRTEAIPRWFVYLVLAGPLMYAVSQILSAVQRVDVAHTFADMSSHVGDCPSKLTGKAGEECAKDLLSDQSDPLLIALSLAGSVATAFLFVMLPLRARRVGLLSQFMGVLGAIVGVLLVLQLVPIVPVIVEAFWLGAMGALYLGRWPGGRGPAWDSGEAEPWPSPSGRAGLFARPAEGPPGEPASEPEAAAGATPERPSSRKRRRKKR
jgi:hypothetical protein